MLCTLCAETKRSLTSNIVSGSFQILHASKRINKGGCTTAYSEFQEAMLLNAWVDKIPELLAVVEQYSLHDCQGEEKAALQAMLDEPFATEQRQQLAVSEVPKHLAAIQSICGRVAPMELQLFSTVKHCDAFFDFLKEKSFYDRCACLICWPVLYVDWPLMRPLSCYNETLGVEEHNATSFALLDMADHQKHTGQTRAVFLLVCCSKGIQRFEGIIQNLNGVLMFEEYHMRVLADVQQAQKLMAPFLQASSLSDLFDKVCTTIPLGTQDAGYDAQQLTSMVYVHLCSSTIAQSHSVHSLHARHSDGSSADLTFVCRLPL